ncbi:MAG TPA: MarR family transcriptional regulator [Phyllobacterium sp.]|nr:MarR family transcriptional regulator [Phyllobacterium sp.]
MTLAEEAYLLLNERPEFVREIVKQYARRRQQAQSFGARYGVTSRQADLLDFVRAYADEHGGVTPTMQEMAEALGLQSKSGVIRLLKGLEDRGHIERLPRRARAIYLRDGAAA